MEKFSSNNISRWTTKIKCAYCGSEVYKKTGAVNRAIKIGKPLYCNKICAGLGRRKNISVEEKKKLKAEYDREYRKNNREQIKERKAEYFQRTYDPEKERIKRKITMPRHVEYCRRPEY